MKIALHQITQIAPKLHMHGLIQPQLFTQGLQTSFARPFSQHHLCRIAWHQMDHQKHQSANSQQRWKQKSDAF